MMCRSLFFLITCCIFMLLPSLSPGVSNLITTCLEVWSSCGQLKKVSLWRDFSKCKLLGGAFRSLTRLLGVDWKIAFCPSWRMHSDHSIERHIIIHNASFYFGPQQRQMTSDSIWDFGYSYLFPSPWTLYQLDLFFLESQDQRSAATSRDLLTFPKNFLRLFLCITARDACSTLQNSSGKTELCEYLRCCPIGKGIHFFTFNMIVC